MDRKIPILIVDDFSTMRRILKSSLQQLGFENITEAEDAEAALSKLQEGEFKLVISDWDMPDMMGFDLLRAVRSDEKLKELPFLMIAAEGHKHSASQVINETNSNYILKPFTPEDLRARLDAILARRA